MSAQKNQQTQHWLYRPQNRARLWRGFVVVLAISVLAQIFIHIHDYFTVDGWFGFHAAYGFLTCAAMVLFARLLGYCLKRPEDYYDND